MDVGHVRGLPRDARLYTSKSKNNPGRQFYAVYEPTGGEKDRLKWFCWVDMWDETTGRRIKEEEENVNTTDVYRRRGRTMARKGTSNSSATNVELMRLINANAKAIRTLSMTVSVQNKKTRDMMEAIQDDMTHNFDEAIELLERLMPLVPQVNEEEEEDIDEFDSDEEITIEEDDMEIEPAEPPAAPKKTKRKPVRYYGNAYLPKKKLKMPAVVKKAPINVSVKKSCAKVHSAPPKVSPKKQSK